MINFDVWFKWIKINYNIVKLKPTVDTLLQINPRKRPTWDKILSMPIVVKRIEKFFPEDLEQAKESVSILMSTIRVPRNLLYLTEKLPKSKYSMKKSKRIWYIQC